MKQTTAHASAATGATGAALIIAQYVATTFLHLAIPVDVASAAIVLLSPVVHMMMTHGTPDNPNQANPGD